MPDPKLENRVSYHVATTIKSDLGWFGEHPEDASATERAGRSPSPPRSNCDHGKGSVAAIAGLAVDRSSSRRGG